MGHGKSLSAAIISAAAAIFGAGAGTAAHAQEIKFWTLSFDNPEMAKTFQSIIKDFEAANPGVTIKLENRGTDEHKSALRVAGVSRSSMTSLNMRATSASPGATSRPRNWSIGFG
jgi:raffinose/stachyose/melibiose transport system substrate-binding protein